MPLRIIRKETRIVENDEITKRERLGIPEPSIPFPRCPVCGEEADTFYKDVACEVVGCENCIRTVDAWDEISNL